ncbi:MAG: DUF2207 domain-containing protein [Ginsengibacter sp.]
MKKLFVIILLSAVFSKPLKAQEYFTIKQYNVEVKINKNSSIDIAEKINVQFSEPRHGIIRKIQYKYKIQPIPEGAEKAKRDLQSNGYNRIVIDDIKVPGWKYEVSNSGDYKSIKIGSANEYVRNDQQFVITYHIENAINFFKDHSEFYFNLIGNEWNTSIEAVNFTIELPSALIDTSNYFVATGAYGSRQNNTSTKWISNAVFSGHITRPLNANEGVTVGISFPQAFLDKPDYSLRGIFWLLLPILAFGGMFYIWKHWGKDDDVVIQTEYYPPENISPGISGYIIDGKLDRRDLTALVPYWGAGGYLEIKELDKKHLLGLVKTKEYEFVKLKDLPSTALAFEKTFFNGIFKSGNEVQLSDLKNKLYTSMNVAKSELQSEIDRGDYYVKYSRGMVSFFSLIGFGLLVLGIVKLVSYWFENKWMGIAMAASGISVLIFGLLMSKKTPKGTALYQKLFGFKEFIKSVEKDRLQEFLKQDENYFDKVLPYAIVFDVADKWKDKLKGLDVPPPSWYHGSYAGSNFNTLLFMNSLDNSMRAMTSTFYSAPSSSGSSGGSFSGGGGFSGGGFGGGGGSSW